MVLNLVSSDELFHFPRGKPFTKNNVLKFINGIIDGSIRSKKFRLPDSHKGYLAHIKSVKKVKHDKFAEVTFSEEKDAVVLFFDSNKIDENVEKVIKAFGRAAKRFRDLKIKSVQLISYDVAQNALPEGINVDTTPKVLIFSAKNKSSPYEIKQLTAENIMKETEAHANIQITLPKFPHLDEKEFVALEAGSRIEDL